MSRNAGPSRTGTIDPKDENPKTSKSPRSHKEEKSGIKRKLPEKMSRKEIEHLVHELEVHQFELEMQNHELRRSQSDLEESRNRYSNLYDFSPIGYFTFDENGLILDINLTGASQLGMERRSLVKKKFHFYIPFISKEIFRSHIRSVFKKKDRRNCEIKINRIDNKKSLPFFAYLDSIYVEEASGAGTCRTAVLDITNRKSAEEGLRETNETLQALIHAAPLAIYLIDPNGRVKSWNRAAERIFGWRRDEVIGCPLPSIPYEKREEFAALHERVMRGDALTGFETIRQRKDGSRIDVNLSTAVLHHVDGSVRGIMAISEEITQRKKSEEAIKKMNEALKEKNVQVEKASQSRKRFLSYISHELKTPLNSIVGFTQLLRNGSYGPLNGQQSRALGLVHKSAGELLRLINNILDLAKMESGKMPTWLIETDLPELLERVCMVFEPFIHEKGLRLDQKISPSLPKPFLTDPNKIKSILGNLLSNAIKFTERGEIEISLQPLSGIDREGAPSPKGIQMIVSDTGAGIEMEDLGKIFEEYEQISNVTKVSEEYAKGSGLGLAIVKKMVSSLNGKIEVKSTPGSGATFTIKIPHPSVM
jgi:PAS domain S-box-containing protein